jgi:hypothetical protein
MHAERSVAVKSTSVAADPRPRDVVDGLLDVGPARAGGVEAREVGDGVVPPCRHRPCPLRAGRTGVAFEACRTRIALRIDGGRSHPHFGSTGPVAPYRPRDGGRRRHPRRSSKRRARPPARPRVGDAGKDRGLICAYRPVAGLEHRGAVEWRLGRVGVSPTRSASLTRLESLRARCGVSHQALNGGPRLPPPSPAIVRRRRRCLVECDRGETGGRAMLNAASQRNEHGLLPCTARRVAAALSGGLRRNGDGRLAG